MVIDSLDSAENYYSLGSGIQAALEFLKGHGFTHLEPGRVDILAIDRQMFCRLPFGDICPFPAGSADFIRRQ